MASVPSQRASFVLGLDVGLDAGEGPRGAVVRSPARYPAADRVLHAGILIQPEEAVAAEVDHRLAADHDGAIGTDGVDDHVLQVAVRKQFGIVFEEANQPILAQRRGQFLEGGRTHGEPLLQGRVGGARAEPDCDGWHGAGRMKPHSTASGKHNWERRNPALSPRVP